jgi:hypothetical protein
MWETKHLAPGDMVTARDVWVRKRESFWVGYARMSKWYWCGAIAVMSLWAVVVLTVS